MGSATSHGESSSRMKDELQPAPLPSFSRSSPLHTPRHLLFLPPQSQHPSHLSRAPPPPPPPSPHGVLPSPTTLTPLPPPTGSPPATPKPPSTAPPPPTPFPTFSLPLASGRRVLPSSTIPILPPPPPRVLRSPPNPSTTPPPQPPPHVLSPPCHAIFPPLCPFLSFSLPPSLPFSTLLARSLASPPLTSSASTLPPSPSRLPTSASFEESWANVWAKPKNLDVRVAAVEKSKMR
ncbi:hypothetical protein Fmac_008147 [Flemingia macrophylla]|uniref:Uncharacterized protein n=1 Tax=Flemingia macrophylla TaxID=520843 RepID=A0ABD1MWK9_9FABA